VQLRVVGSSVCHTDLVIRDQYVPVPLPVPGHEGAGIVERVGRNVCSVKPGDHVLMSYHSCGHYPSCHEGSPAYCNGLLPNNFSGRRLDGSVSVRLQGQNISASFSSNRRSPLMRYAPNATSSRRPMT
jgi:aryl-alcohol dehydrogenase